MFFYMIMVLISYDHYIDYRANHPVSAQGQAHLALLYILNLSFLLLVEGSFC